MIPYSFVLFLLAVGISPAARIEPTTLDLSGTWQFRMDPDDEGVNGKWFSQTLPDRIELPGSMTENGLGDEVSVNTPWTGGIVDRSWFTEPKYEPYRRPGDIKVPFWLTPLKYYVGPAWYRRNVDIPSQWQGRQIVLELERPHWETRVWLDGKPLGMRNSLSTPHRYNLGELTAGKHSLAIRIDNTVKIGVGINSHSVSDHTQTNWNGVVGAMTLCPVDPLQIDDIQVYPDQTDKTVRTHIRFSRPLEEGRTVDLKISARQVHPDRSHSVAPRTFTVKSQAGQAEYEVVYPMGPGVRLWDEFSPNLYELTVLAEADDWTGSRSTEFGMRDFSTEGTQFTINGRRTFLRGTLECCIFPRTGYPPTDLAEWLRILRVAKAHGLNHLRFHSWCPPEAAFQAADREGVYLHVECGSWANQGSSIGDGKPVDDFIYAEGDRILAEYGNHPSFCMLAYGNEPAGGNQRTWLAELITYWRKKDPRRLYTSAAGWPIIPENEFHSTPDPRIQAWGAGLSSRINAHAPETVTDYRDFVERYEVPVVSHEIGQWCVYPNLAERAKYTGTLRAYNFDIFADSLAANHMFDQAHDFLIASGKLQTLCYKEEIESALRTPGFGGFQLLDLHDFPGQGTALVGVLDPFWEPKGYVTAKEYRRFCGETVPLARMPKRVWTTDEAFSADIQIAHFGPAPLQEQTVEWSFKTAAGRTVASGEFTPDQIPIGNGSTIGVVSAPLTSLKQASKCNLKVTLSDTDYANDWDLWVYPANPPVEEANNVHVTRVLDDQTIARLREGGDVLLIPAAGTVDSDVQIGFSSIFWNTAWTRGQAPHTLGILCDPKHPALSRFPTDFHTNWQWWELISRSQAMVLDELPPAFRPVVQVIDDWTTNHRLGLIVEARVGTGRLLICSIDLESDLDARPVARQLRHSLLRYMTGRDFHPRHELSPDQVRTLFRKPTRLQSLGATILETDSQQKGYEAAKAIDANPSSIWHTAWEPSTPDYPHHITLDLGRPVSVAGFQLLPRQDMNHGWFRRWRLAVSGTPDFSNARLQEGVFVIDKHQKTVRFEQPLAGRYLRLTALKGIAGQRYASIAEFDILTE